MPNPAPLPWDQLCLLAGREHLLMKVGERVIVESDERHWQRLKAERDAEAEEIAYGGCYD